VLGVFRDVVVDEYVLTARHLAERQIAGGLADHEPASGGQGRARAVILRRFEAIDREYGSFDSFVGAGLGLTEREVDVLRTRLLR
jgi:hypothetical protein